MAGIRRIEGPTGPVPERQDNSKVKPVRPALPAVPREPDRDTLEISEEARKLLEQSQKTGNPEGDLDELPEDEALE